MLEVNLVRRSRNGVAIPVGRSDNPDLVRDVATRMLDEMDRWRFSDELLDDLADRERQALQRAIADEGIDDTRNAK